MEIVNNTAQELGLPDGSTLKALGKTKISKQTWDQWAHNPVMRAWLNAGFVRPVVPLAAAKPSEPESTPSWRDRFNADNEGD